MMYLIAHKVRGQRAFDVAEPMDINGQTWWIITTSGHRAYPYWSVPLAEVAWGLPIIEMSYNGMKWLDVEDVPSMPADLPDHYPAMVRVKHEPVIIDLEELDL